MFHPASHWALQVAAPRDARSIVADSTSSVEAVALRVAEVGLGATDCACRMRHGRQPSGATVAVTACCAASPDAITHPGPRLPRHPLSITQIVKKAGLSSALVNQQKSGLGAITITGWVAFASLASLVLLVLALAAFGAWHFMRGGRQQHRYSRVREMKQGDV